MNTCKHEKIGLDDFISHEIDEKVDVQSVCVSVIVQIAILNLESFSNCLTAKARLGPM